MIKLPNPKWIQINSSDKIGPLSSTKNINLDKEGYLSLSPRSVTLINDTDDTDWNIPVSFGRYSAGTMRLVTTEDPFDLSYSNTGLTLTEDTSSDNPNFAFNSHGVWWQNKWHTSTDTTVTYNDSGTWDSSPNITGLTSGVRHYLCVFKNRNTLVVSNGNVLKQYDTSYSGTTDLTIPSDFEITGLAYNNNQTAIITRLGDNSEGQNAEAYFFVWDGASTSANKGVSLGAYAGIAVTAYKSSFVVLTSEGQLLYWNGGGFEELAHFPFYDTDVRNGDLTTFQSYGDALVVDGDIIYINIGFDFSGIGTNDEETLVGNPCGVWCFDPRVGLYHRYSPSISHAYFHTIAQADVNTTTNVFTTASTIPNTGNQVIMTLPKIGGLKTGVVYYVIKLSSTTFKLAESYADAIDGIAIDITSADTTNYFVMYDLVDYGTTQFVTTGGVGLWGTNSAVFNNVIFGGKYFSTTLGDTISLCTPVPFLENRGYFVTSKFFLDSIKEEISKEFIKHKPLGVNDAIIVKVKQHEYEGIPTSSPNSISSDEFAWTSSTTGTTNSDLSKVKTLFDAGEEFEIELTAGLGAGQMIKITNITESGGTYTVTVEDAVIGYSSNLKSHFIIDNWKFCASVDYDSQKEGVFEVPIATTGKSLQFKMELRGYKTTVEEATFINKKQLPAI